MFDNSLRAISRVVIVLCVTGYCYAQADVSAQLLEAAVRGDAPAIRDLLAQGASPNARDEKRATPLMNAAGRGDREMVRVLLDAGAEVDALNEEGYSALMYAAAGKDASVAALLLDRGAQLDRRALTASVLGIAASNGDPTVVSLLLSRGADPNARCPNLNTPVVRAIHWNRPDNLQLLLAAGAELDSTLLDEALDLHSEDLPNEAERCAMNWRCMRLAGGKEFTDKTGPFDELAGAIKSGDAKLVATLLTRKQFQDFYALLCAQRLAADEGLVEIHALLAQAGANALQERDRVRSLQQLMATAASEGNLERVRDMLPSMGRDPRLMTHCLRAAAIRGQVRVVKYLIAAGGNPNEALISAAENQHPEIAEAVLGIQVPTPWKASAEALLAWAGASRADLVKLLLARSVDANAYDSDGMTALMMAARSGDMSTIDVLISAGGRIDRANFKGQTALTIARSEFRPRIVTFLEEHGAPPGTGIYNPLIAGVQPLGLARVRELVEAGADPNVRNPDLPSAWDWPLLFQVLSAGDVELARLMIARGAHVAPGAITAAVRGVKNEADYGIIQFLMDRGADIEESPSNDGQTPLMVAAESRPLSLVQWLMDKGANVAAKDVKGKTALDRATAQSRKDVAELLKQAASGRAK